MYLHSLHSWKSSTAVPDKANALSLDMGFVPIVSVLEMILFGTAAIASQRVDVGAILYVC